jgi:hypothetical protein
LGAIIDVGGGAKLAVSGRNIEAEVRRALDMAAQVRVVDRPYRQPESRIRRIIAAGCARQRVCAANPGTCLIPIVLFLGLFIV